MAGSPPSLYPDFAELCRQARQIEKNLLKAPQSQISGTIRPDESQAIFPREFEEYTYSYLLSEAHKIERRLFAAKYETALSAPATGKAGTQALSDERQIEEELHGLAAYSPKAAPSMPSQEKPSLQIPIPKVQLPSLQKRQGKVSPPPVPSARPAGEEQGEVPFEAKEFEEEKGLASPLPEEGKTAPGKAAQGQVLIPGEEEAPAPSKAERKQVLIPEEEELPEPEVPLPQEERRAAVPEEGQPPAISGRPPPENAKAASAPRLSPRLRAIIEEKLRRDEQKAAAREEEEAPALKAEEEEEPAAEEETPAAKTVEEEVVLSSRERLLRKLREKEAVRPKPEEAGELLQEEEQLEPEPEGQGLKEEAPHAAEKGEVPARIAPVPPGGLQIKPIFTGEGEAKEQKEEEASPQEAPGQEERMQRIKRILGELASDRSRAASITPQPKQSPLQGKKQPAAPKAKKSAAILQTRAEEAEEAETPPSQEAEVPEEVAQPQEQPAAVPGKEPLQKPVSAPVAGKAGRKKSARQPRQAAQKIPAEKKKAAAIRPPAKEEAEDGQKKARKPVTKQKKLPAGMAQKQAVQKTPPSEEKREEFPPTPVKKQPGQGAAAAERQREFPSTLVGKQQEEPETPVRPGVRILPGGVAVARTGLGTYVQPKIQRQVLRPSPQPQEQGQQPEPVAVRPSPKPAEEERQVARRKAQAEKAPTRAAKKAPAQPEKEQEQGREATPQIPRAVLERIEKSVPRKAASDEPVEKTAAELEEEEKRSRTAMLFESKLRQFEQGKKPGAEKEEEELEVPMPPPGEEGAKKEEIPRPEDYEAAKQEFRKKAAEGEVREAAKAETEDMLEQYAKENVVWLYEIYKMGGMSREDFLQKVREKAAEERQQSAPEPSAPENPALASINKELEKRKKDSV